MKPMPKILIYTDGSSLGNPGPGGYGIVMKTSDGRLEKTFSKGFKKTTNNRMELMAVIDALKKIKQKDWPVEIYTDSKYVSDAVNKAWLNKWLRQKFTKTKNPDLWKEFIRVTQGLNYTIHWVKGHNNHPENEQCDQLAVMAAKEAAIHTDKGYKPSSQTSEGLF